jgi:hypothetical protein
MMYVRLLAVFMTRRATENHEYEIFITAFLMWAALKLKRENLGNIIEKPNWV